MSTCCFAVTYNSGPAFAAGSIQESATACALDVPPNDGSGATFGPAHPTVAAAAMKAQTRPSYDQGIFTAVLTTAAQGRTPLNFVTVLVGVPPAGYG